MPKTPIDYSNTQIYKWVCNDPNINSCYVGHTTNWVKRKASHKERCNDEKSKKYHLQIYQIMRMNGGIENWNMILIEDYPCDNKREAEKREQYWKDELKPDMNTLNAFVDISSYHQQLKLHPNHNKERYEKNKEKIKERVKEYAIDHKQQKKEYDKKYREENKEQLEQKYYCECCKSEVLKRHLKRHEHTRKHLDNVKES